MQCVVKITGNLEKSSTRWCFMDALDIRIVEALQQDGSLTKGELAERVGSTPSTCLRRAQKLIDGGILTRSIYLADAEKLGRGLRAIILVTTRDHRRRDREGFAEKLRAEPAISLAYGVTGDVDALLIGNFRSMSEYQDTCDRLFDGDDSVVRYTTCFAADLYKEETAIPCDALSASRAKD